MVVSITIMIMIMIMAVMVVVVGPEPVQLQILLLSQFLRELGHSKLLLTWTMMMMMMMMGMASVIAVVVSMRLMDRRCTGSRMVTLVPKAQIQPKSDNQHYRDLPLQKPHFQFFVAETLISLRKNKKERTEKRVKRSFSKGVFGCKGLGRTALAGALDGDEANGTKKKQDNGDYNTKCDHIHFLFIKPSNLLKACFFLNSIAFHHCHHSAHPWHQDEDIYYI